MRFKYLVLMMVLAVTLSLVLRTLQEHIANAGVLVHAVAKTACSCVYVAGRNLGDCRKDDPPGFEWVRSRLDAEVEAVQASLFGVIRGRAVYQDGLGCRPE